VVSVYITQYRFAYPVLQQKILGSISYLFNHVFPPVFLFIAYVTKPSASSARNEICGTTSHPLCFRFSSSSCLWSVQTSHVKHIPDLQVGQVRPSGLRSMPLFRVNCFILHLQEQSVTLASQLTIVLRVLPSNIYGTTVSTGMPQTQSVAHGIIGTTTPAYRTSHRLAVERATRFTWSMQLAVRM
jgi:hypothetical protein